MTRAWRQLSPGARVDLAFLVGGYGHLRRFWPKSPPVDVIVVATWREANLLGSRNIRGIEQDSAGRRYISVAAGPRAVEGLRVGEVEWTENAWRAPTAAKLDECLRRSQAKSGRLGRANKGSQ